MLIALEGIDGSGKSTQAGMLYHALTARGRRARVIHFPDYATVSGAEIRRMLADENRSALALQSLMLCNRLEHLDTLRAFEADRSAVLILDRYWLSGYVYGQVDGLPSAWLRRVHAVLPAPDVWAVLDVPLEISFERRAERADAYEADRDRIAEARRTYARALQDRDIPGSLVGFNGTLDKYTLRDGLVEVVDYIDRQHASRLGFRHG